MTRSYVFGIVTCAALAAASAAQAGCQVFFNHGEGLMPNLGTCLFMGTEADYETWGAEACGGMTDVYVMPSYNDRIVGILSEFGGRITLLQNVMRDGNSITYDMAAEEYIELEAPWRETATVFRCE